MTSKEDLVKSRIAQLTVELEIMTRELADINREKEKQLKRDAKKLKEKTNAEKTSS